MAEPRIHGTYPFDDYGADYANCWVRLRDLSVAKAAALTGVPLPPVVEEGQTYLWLNKGYILLTGTREEGLTPLQASLVEDTARFSRRVAPGAQAVYLHDGKYSLIERTVALQTHRE